MAKSTAAKREQRISGREQRKLREEQARKRTIAYSLVAIAAALFVLALAVFLVVRDDDDQGSDLPPVVAASSGITAPVDGRIAGEPDAPVSVVEWGDYQCPGCAAFNREAKPVLVEEYVNTGQITFEFRDFAFLGPESFKAAEAAWCAADQSRFWDYHDTLYANQGAENSGALSDDRLKEMAAVLELDEEAFNTCFDDRVHEEDVVVSYEDGSALGVNSTPTLVIDGELVPYAGIDDLRARIDAALGE